MRKVMLLAALLAMVLAAAAPAVAQTATGGRVAILQYSCNQIQAAVNTQYQSGNGTGAVAGAAQSLGINQQQVLACFGTAAGFQQSPISVTAAKAAKASAKAAKASAKAAKATAPAKAAKATAAAPAKAAPAAAAPAAAAPAAAAGAAMGGKLPPTGGVSPLALGAAVLLVAGGLLARRIFR